MCCAYPFASARSHNVWISEKTSWRWSSLGYAEYMNHEYSGRSSSLGCWPVPQSVLRVKSVE
jgi:hypothetical protein